MVQGFNSLPTKKIGKSKDIFFSKRTYFFQPTKKNITRTNYTLNNST